MDNLESWNGIRFSKSTVVGCSLVKLRAYNCDRHTQRGEPTRVITVHGLGCDRSDELSINPVDA